MDEQEINAIAAHFALEYGADCQTVRLCREVKRCRKMSQQYLEAAQHLTRYIVPVEEFQRLARRWPFLLPDDDEEPDGEEQERRRKHGG